MNPLPYLANWFPHSLGYSISENDIGHSDSRVFFIEYKGKKTYVLKCNPLVSNRNLESEKANLEWLENKLKIPKVEEYKVDQNWEWLLTEFVDGQPSFEYGKGREAEVGKILGETLAEIHSIPFKDYPKQSNHTLLMMNELNKGNDNREIDPVFSHGDYCLPNILIQSGVYSGLIDLGDAGIYDRYHDVFWCIWSLKYNHLTKGIKPFLSAYGIKELDEDRFLWMEKLNHMVP